VGLKQQTTHAFPQQIGNESKVFHQILGVPEAVDGVDKLANLHGVNKINCLHLP
jgi:hypothetical protein